MQRAIIMMMKALAQLLAAHYREYDHETSAVMQAMADYVQKNEMPGM